MSIFPQGRSTRGFTLIELLVVISIIALLIAILVPALGQARRTALRMKCLSNMRNMQIAHWMYVTDHDGRMIDAGLSHGGGSYDDSLAWFTTLSEYYGSELLHRSPVDDSPHWGPAPEGLPIPGSSDPNQRRITSYGINNWLSVGNVYPPFYMQPPYEPIFSPPYAKVDAVPSPADTVHFLIMTYTGSFAGADHIHVENWGASETTPAIAATQVQTNAHRGPAGSWESESNYGFLDGHATTLKFREVYTDFEQNRFDPVVAR